MFELPDLRTLSNIHDVANVSYADGFDHGLGRDREHGIFAMFGVRTSISTQPRTVCFGITQMHPLSLESGASEETIHQSINLLHHHVTAWQDRVSYQRLGAFLHLIPDYQAEDSSEEDADTTTQHSADKRFVLHPHHYGYLRLHSLMSRAFKHALSGEDLSEYDTRSIEMAQRALAELLPQQAYLFIPPHDLMMATKEAERIAAETIQHAKIQPTKESAKPNDLYGQVKHKLSHGIRALRTRHDGRMHIFPYTELSAPDTGVATIAIIASQQQSIVGDHGRYSANARGLVI